LAFWGASALFGDEDFVSRLTWFVEISTVFSPGIVNFRDLVALLIAEVG